MGFHRNSGIGLGNPHTSGQLKGDVFILHPGKGELFSVGRDNMEVDRHPSDNQQLAQGVKE